MGWRGWGERARPGCVPDCSASRMSPSHWAVRFPEFIPDAGIESPCVDGGGGQGGRVLALPGIPLVALWVVTVALTGPSDR